MHAIFLLLLNRMDPLLFRNVLTSASSLKSLVVKNVCSDAMLKLIGNHCPFLQHLDISNSKQVLSVLIFHVMKLIFKYRDYFTNSCKNFSCYRCQTVELNLFAAKYKLETKFLVFIWVIRNRVYLETRKEMAVEVIRKLLERSFEILF